VICGSYFCLIAPYGSGKEIEEILKMVTNIYGKKISNLERMRVEEKISHIKENIPDDLYEVLTTEWRQFVTTCVQKGKGERKLAEFDYYFELFMKFPH
tara:strand:- start:74 stop:367 length:294 start_codon:yes stop_codon:yes gene_type:complete